MIRKEKDVNLLTNPEEHESVIRKEVKEHE